MDIRIPEVGESVREALLAKWFKKTGELVKKDDPLCEIETDKITLDLNADVAGILSIQVEEGVTVKIGTIIGTIAEQTGAAQVSPAVAAFDAAPVSHENEITATVSSPSIRREMREQDVDPDSVSGTGRGGRITLDDLFSRIEGKARRIPAPVSEDGRSALPPNVSVPTASTSLSRPSATGQTAVAPVLSVRSEEAPSYDARREERKAMSPIRKRIAERLLAVRQQTAMLTTFNEADMTHVTALREKYRDHFKMLHGAPLGLMPFFVKACVEALREFPTVNASIDGDDFVFHNYYDIGIAIGAEKGLVVPVLRNADKLKYYEIDQAIAAYKEKITTNHLAISDLEGGTFSISNGGVYGSLLSTPILNPPQSAVLGMHAIQERAVVRDGQIVIRPMMYLALSYDHRIIDGREAVGFLKKVKEYIEEPEELLLEG
ncbi:MAG: 2-oxoglutarate dehydrogenase complex dihydrolipoyllysine-residue succinyltransferase [Verrucomicrobia bacterium]|nr:2-oxoglutarate dehydrogenase complex dihydrolipoyllysine-residue succinyltransferase [Deltaproteobacteria bacterium]